MGREHVNILTDTGTLRLIKRIGIEADFLTAKKTLQIVLVNSSNSPRIVLRKFLEMPLESLQKVLRKFSKKSSECSQQVL